MDEIKNAELIDGGYTEETEAPEAQEREWNLDDLPDDVAAAPAAEPEKYRLKHLGEEIDVTRGEVIALAQKGRDYDRLRSRLYRLESAGEPNSAALVRNVNDFVAMYGNSVKPETIPAEVWTSVSNGTPLVVAYQSYENQKLRGQIKTYDNRTRATHGASSAGESGGEGSIESSWYSD